MGGGDIMQFMRLEVRKLPWVLKGRKRERKNEVAAKFGFCSETEIKLSHSLAGYFCCVFRFITLFRGNRFNIWFPLASRRSGSGWRLLLQ